MQRKEEELKGKGLCENRPTAGLARADQGDMKAVWLKWRVLRRGTVVNNTETLGDNHHAYSETIITLISKPDKDTTRKLQIRIPDDYRNKNP